MGAALDLLRAFKLRLAQEAAEDAGLVPVAGDRPRCPACGFALECVWGKRSKAFLIIHGRNDCTLRWGQFGSGATAAESWQDAQKELAQRTAE